MIHWWNPLMIPCVSIYSSSFVAGSRLPALRCLVAQKEIAPVLEPGSHKLVPKKHKTRLNWWNPNWHKIVSNPSFQPRGEAVSIYRSKAGNGHGQPFLKETSGLAGLDPSLEIYFLKTAATIHLAEVRSTNSNYFRRVTLPSYPEPKGS